MLRRAVVSIDRRFGWDEYGPTRRAQSPLLVTLALWGLYSIDGRNTPSRFWRDGVDRVIEVIYQVKVKCKGRHRENPVRRIDTAAMLMLGFEHTDASHAT